MISRKIPPQAFTLIMPESIYSSQREISMNIDFDIAGYTEKVEGQLREKGFYINIEIFEQRSGYDNKAIFKEYIMSKLETCENVIFQPRSYFTEDEIRQLAADGLIMEISDIYKNYAPNYYSRYTYGNQEINYYLDNNVDYYFTDSLDKEKIYGIPIGITRLSLARPALLVRNDIAKDYKQEIDSFEDYVDLLVWVKENEKKSSPGFFPNTYTCAFINSTIPMYDLFTCITGYSDCSALFEDTLYTGYYFENANADDIRHKGGIDVLPAALIPGFREFMLGFYDLSRNGYIYLGDVSAYMELKEKNDYATIFTNTLLYTRPETSMFAKFDIDASGYVMYLFNEAGLEYSFDNICRPYASALYISAGSAEPEEMMRFIEWLYDSQVNYDLFIYGEEYEDYKIKNDRILYLDEGSRSAWSSLQFNDIMNDDYNRIDSYAPGNWEDLLAWISDIPRLREMSLFDLVLKNSGLSYEELDEIRDKHDKSTILDSYQNMACKKVNDAFISSLFVDMSPDPESVIDEYINTIAEMKEVNKVIASYEECVDIFIGYLEN